MSRAQLAERLDGELDEALEDVLDLEAAFGRLAKFCRDLGDLCAGEQARAARHRARLQRWVALREQVGE